MTSPLASKTEKYREQLETRARIHHHTSELWLHVTAAPDGQGWIAALSSHEDANADAPLDWLRCIGDSAETALYEFAEQLDLIERESQTEPTD